MELTQEERTFEFTKDEKKRVFIYDPDLMPFAQIADTNTKLGMYENMVKVLPLTLSDVQEAMKKDVLNKGLAALLIELNPDTKLPLKDGYDMNTHTGKELMQNMKGVDDFLRLNEVCKGNFFIRQGHISNESIMGLATTISELQKQGVKDETINSIAQDMIKAAEKGELEELKILVETSTQEDTSKENIGTKPE